MAILNTVNDIFQSIVLKVPDNNCNYIERPNNLKIVDAGIEVPGGWSAAKGLLEGLILGLGQVVIGDMVIKDIKLPTVDLLLDDPVKIAELSYFNKFDDHGLSILGPNIEKDEKKLGFGYAVTNKIPEALSIEGNLIIASNTSLVNAVYNASLPTMLAVKALLEEGVGRENILWSWSSCAVAVLADDEQVMKKRNMTMLKHTSVISIWLKADIKTIEKITNNWEYGELRLHELTSAKTYICGVVDAEDFLGDIY